ncbi:MAG: hypothetical protein GXP46_01790 [Deferribacteres bacterium]|nr:hypothetical protein [Deferribacteres bacterium]
MNMVQFIYDFHPPSVTKGNKFDVFSFFYHSGKVWGHVSESTAPLHHRVSIYYLFKENKRKSKKKRWCNLSATVVQYGAMLVHPKPSKNGLHHDFLFKNQDVIRDGAVVQLKKCPIDCQDEGQLHHDMFLRALIMKTGDIC